MTNVDYKIIAKSLTIRLRKVMPKLVNEDQNGYIKGRSAAIVIRTLDDILKYTEDHKLPGILLSIDYSKAFDTISKEFMLSCFKMFNFGEYFSKWISVINNGMLSCINYCGWLSDWFPIECGIRQGCPLSPMCFVLACEILSCKIRQSQKIKGISVQTRSNKNDIRLQQYADDSTLILSDEASVTESLHLIEIFSKISGLRLNKGKTEAIWLGCWKHKQKQIGGIKWKVYPENTIKILGVHLKPDCMLHENSKNWETKFNKCEKIMKSWCSRNLTLIGRITLAKSLLCSQFNYLLQATILPDLILNRISTMLFKFVWSKNAVYKEHDLKCVTERVKRDILIQTYENKGLQMIDVKMIQIAYAFKWVSLLSNNGNGSWRLIPNHYFGQLSKGLTAFKFNTQFQNLRGMQQTFPYFYKNLLQLWLNVRFKYDTKVSANINQIIWNNDNFKYKGNVLFNRRWIKNDIIFWSDIVDDNGHPNYQKVADCVGDCELTKFEFNSIQNTNLRNKIPSTAQNEDLYILDQNINSVTSKKIRQSLVSKIITGTSYWASHFGPQADSKAVWSLIPSITSETRLIELQWKILHGIYPTNAYLHKIGISVTNKCLKCNEIEYLQHFFYTCKELRKFWETVSKTFIKYVGKQIHLNEETVLLGLHKENNIYNITVKESAVINHILVIAKLCISKFKHGEHTNILILLESEMSWRLKDRM